MQLQPSCCAGQPNALYACRVQTRESPFAPTFQAGPQDVSGVPPALSPAGYTRKKSFASASASNCVSAASSGVSSCMWK